MAKTPEFRCDLCGARTPITRRYEDEQYGDVCPACQKLILWDECNGVDPVLYERGIIARPMTRDEKVLYTALERGIND